MILLLVLIHLSIIALILEGVARIHYRRRFLVPFRPKVVGEYPFKSFLVEEDKPLYFSFKKGFRSPIVNINRFGIRGPEPAPDGAKKRILVIGESNIFGVKLRHEELLWSVRLEKMLTEKGYDNWEVLNAGNPGYNTLQHRAFWERELRRTRPDILLISMYVNEITQAWVMGSQWKPGKPWPIDFIYTLERKSPWWNKAAGYSCLYFFLRRMKANKGKVRNPFTPRDNLFQWQQCQESILANFRAIIEDAEAMGTQVATFEGALAYDFQLTDDDKKRISSIQSNWDTFLEGKARYDYEFIDIIANTFAPMVGVPHINLAEDFRRHPRRFELYYDLAHVNEDGMRVYAEALYEHLDNLGWLTRKGEQRI